MDRFLAAARLGNINIVSDIPTVQQLYEKGAASVLEADRDGMIALALATHFGRDGIVEFNKHGSNIGFGKESHLILGSLSLISYNHNDESGAAMISLLKVAKIITLLGTLPSFEQGFLLHHELIDKGRQLRAQLPAYLEQRCALIVTHCPLPTVLQKVVAAYADLTYADVWESGLL
jgi:hypothetical protein